MSVVLYPWSTGRRDSPGSAWLVEMDGVRLLLDAGPGAWVQRAEGVDAVFVTHAHHDHVGGLIDVVERFPRAPRVATPETMKYLRHVLFHDLRQRNGLVSRADAIVDTMQAQKFHTKRTFGSVEVSLWPAGHVPGSSMVLVEGSSRVLYTGDWGTFPVPGWSAVVWPEQVDVLVLECSIAGIRRLDDFDPMQAIPDLKEALPALVVAGGLGEAQAVYALVSGEIHVHENLQTFIDAPSYVDEDESLAALRSGASVLVGGKELESDSPSFRLVREIFEDPKASLVFLNGLPVQSTAAKVVHGGHRSRVLGLGRRRCSVKLLALTMHATRPELIDVVERLSPACVVLTHNEPGVLQAMRRHILKRVKGIEVIVPELDPIGWSVG